MTSAQDRKKPRISNKGSVMLRDQENQILFNHLGKNSYSIVAGVAQLLQAHPNPSKWALKDTGVICLVKDYKQRAYFLRMFDITNRGKIFDQQLYENFRVQQQAGVLLSFEGDDRMYGLNFSRADECAEFRSCLNRLYEKQQHQKRKTDPLAHSHQPMGMIQSAVPIQQQQQHHSNSGITSSNVVSHMPVVNDKEGKKKKDKKNKGKSKLSTRDISAPTNFVHKVHIGWNENEGFSLGEVTDPTITELLKTTGMRPEDIQNDPRKRKQFQNFAEQYGGLDGLARQFREEKERQSVMYPAAPSDTGRARAPPPAIPMEQQPPPPARTASHHATAYQSPPHARQEAPAPPPPPRMQPQPQISAPQPTKQHAPPPPRAPPVGRPLPNPPSGSPASSRPAAVPPPPPPNPPAISHNVPPAPPPPPPAGAPPPPAPPPPPPMGMSSAPKAPQPPANDGRSNLLADIRGGAKLRPVAASTGDSPKAGGGGSAMDPKADLMNQIRSGSKTLKHVEPNQHRVSADGPTGDGSIADALRRAMEARAGAMRNSDSEDDSDDDDNSDWDD